MKMLVRSNAECHPVCSSAKLVRCVIGGLVATPAVVTLLHCHDSKGPHLKLASVGISRYAVSSNSATTMSSPLRVWDITSAAVVVMLSTRCCDAIAMLLAPLVR